MNDTDQDEPGWERELWQKIATPPKQRAEIVVEQVSALAAARPPGHRLGAKDELRIRSGVSKGTFNEALRLLQSAGIVSLRRGPGGGVFVAQRSLVSKVRDDLMAAAEASKDPEEVRRLAGRLMPLVVEQAAEAPSKARNELEGVVSRMDAAAAAEDADALRDATTDLYSMIVSLAASPLIRGIMHLVVELRLEQLADETAYLPDPDTLGRFLAAAHDLVAALRAGDASRAVAVVESGVVLHLFSRPRSATRPSASPGQARA